MRYFVVTYARKPNGQHDEAVSVEAKIRNSVRDMATVILDYKDRKVIKMRLPEDQVAAKDFEKIHEYYNKHYETVIKGLEDKFAILEVANDMVTTILEDAVDAD